MLPESLSFRGETPWESCLAFFIRENNFFGANFCLSETVSMLPSSSLRPNTD